MIRNNTSSSTSRQHRTEIEKDKYAIALNKLNDNNWMGVCIYAKLLTLLLTIAEFISKIRHRRRQYTYSTYQVSDAAVVPSNPKIVQIKTYKSEFFGRRFAFVYFTEYRLTSVCVECYKPIIYITSQPCKDENF